MTPTASLHKGLLLYSFALVAILLWLTVNFVKTSYGEKRDTDFLKHYLESDEKFRKASLLVAEEQSATYWVMSFDRLYNTTYTLSNPYENTDRVLAEVLAHGDELFALPNYFDHLKFRRSQLQDLFSDLSITVEKIQEHRDMLEVNLAFPSDQRDEKQELQVLGFYTDLVEQIEMLRFASAYVSPHQTRAVQNLLIVSNAAWNLQLSNERLSALIESYLTTDNLVTGESINRVNYHLNQLNESFASISLIDSYASIDSELNTKALKFRGWFTSSYQLQVNDVAVNMSEGGQAVLNSYEWRQITSRMAEYVTSIHEHVDKLTVQRVESANDKAAAKFIIDIFLVLLCLIFAVLSIWFVRRVQNQAIYDELTKLPNRRLFVTSCSNLVATDLNTSIGLVKIDLSNFKAINDSIGQFAGDELLQKVAIRLQDKFNQASLISRLGSDEFAVLLKCQSQQEFSVVAESVVDVLSGQYSLDNHAVSLKACVGYACFPAHASSSEELIKAADLALHDAKQSGPGSATCFKSSIADAFKERQLLESELELALQRDEFELHYQPQVDVEKQIVDGVEALIRWRHPTRGMVSPFHFIPVAEDAGMLPAIGEWVINQAAKQAAIWKRDYGLDLRISVNVSAQQFIEGDIVEIIRLALARDELSPESFEIEITESVAMFDVKTVVDKLNALHKTGVRIALDDFGTGYSSLSYLQDLPLDTLKIDRSFVTQLDDETRSQKPLLESIALMAKKLNLHTVAEGVETVSQLQQVCDLGIDTIQGFYYSKPVSASQLPDEVKAIDAACTLANAA